MKRITINDLDKRIKETVANIDGLNGDLTVQQQQSLFLERRLDTLIQRIDNQQEEIKKLKSNGIAAVCGVIFAFLLFTLPFYFV